VSAAEAAALRRLDPDALARDAAALVQVPSVTGDERPALARLGELAEALDLPADLHRHDLDGLRRHPGQPGQEAERTELWGLTAELAGGAGRRVCLNGHVDVVDAGTAAWRHGPWSGALDGRRLYGRGSVDMKGGVVAALHALGAVRAAGVAEHAPDVVLQAVASEEDGGLGTFAELERDARFDAALIPEPTSFTVVCAQAGALTFRGVVPGRAAHAADRLSGCSALDRYVRVHAALGALEARINADVANPLMAALALPYPLLVGRIAGGSWSSSVPDRVEFEGRLGVPVGADLDAAREALEQAVAGALDDGEAPAEITWEGGAFAPGETPAHDPWVGLVRRAVGDELGREVPAVGAAYGADMRLFTQRGIACVMAGPPSLDRAHAVDEWVDIDDLAAVARAIVRVILRAGEEPAALD
jgi:acetylornithine deacetylase